MKRFNRFGIAVPLVSGILFTFSAPALFASDEPASGDRRAIARAIERNTAAIKALRQAVDELKRGTRAGPVFIPLLIGIDDEEHVPTTQLRHCEYDAKDSEHPNCSVEMLTNGICVRAGFKYGRPVDFTTTAREGRSVLTVRSVVCFPGD